MQRELFRDRRHPETPAKSFLLPLSAARRIANIDRAITVTEELARIAEKIGWNDHAEFFHKSVQQ